MYLKSKGNTKEKYREKDQGRRIKKKSENKWTSKNRNCSKLHAARVTLRHHLSISFFDSTRLANQPSTRSFACSDLNFVSFRFKISNSLSLSRHSSVCARARHHPSELQFMLLPHYCTSYFLMYNLLAARATSAVATST